MTDTERQNIHDSAKRFAGDPKDDEALKALVLSVVSLSLDDPLFDSMEVATVTAHVDAIDFFGMVTVEGLGS